MSEVSKAEIEAVWEEFGVVDLQRDMTNECRLAAAVVRLRRDLRDLQDLLNEVEQ